MWCFVSDSRASAAEVVNRVARLVSSDKHATGFHNLLGDADIDRFSYPSSLVLFIKNHTAK